MNMDTLAFITAIGLALYAVLVVSVGILSARGESIEGFVIGHRRVGVLGTAGSIGIG